MEYSAANEVRQPIGERQQANFPTCRNDAVETNSLWDDLLNFAMANVILRRAAEDPEAQLYKEQLQRENCAKAEFFKLVSLHHKEVLLPRAASWFCSLDEGTRGRLVNEKLKDIDDMMLQTQERQYWASVKCCRVFNGVTEFLYENGSVELFDSTGR